MDSRGFGSGFSGWSAGGGGGSSSRGYGNFDIGGYGGPMKRGMSGGSILSSGADAVIAKINQRLDMLSHLEGGMKGGGRGDRFDQFESYDSRSSALGPRDLYRSGNFYGDSRGDMMAQRGGMGFGAMGGGGGGGGGGGAGGFDGSAKMRRDMFSDSGWGAGQMSQQRGGRQGGLGFGRRQDPSMLGGGGGQGLSPSGLGKLPSLLSHRLYPDRRGFQPQQRSQFGNQRDNRLQRNRKKGLNRQQQVKPQREGQKKRKQMFTPTQEPKSKVGKKESSGHNNSETEKKKNDGAAATPDTESKPEAEARPADSAGKEAGTQPKTKAKGFPSDNKAKKKRGFFERVLFACSICKYRSFYSEDMQTHMESKFHKDHIKFLSNQLNKSTTDFLQAYLSDKFKKTDKRVKKLENPTATICQIMKEQDLTRDLTLDHFMKKVEAAHCAACDMYIPMQPALIQKHVKSPDHNYNRRGMMEQSKKSSLSVAHSILNHKVIGKKMETFLQGQNPFLDDPEDSVMSEVTEGELKPQGEEPAGDQVPAAVGNGEEHEEAPEPEDMELGVEAAPEEKEQEEEEEEEGAPVREEVDEERNEEEEGEQVKEEEGEDEVSELKEDEGVEVGEEELEKLSELI